MSFAARRPSGPAPFVEVPLPFDALPKFDRELFNSDGSRNSRNDAVYLMFRKLGDPSAAHWANWLAALMTRSWFVPEEFPGGQLCHAELLMQPRTNVWYTFSINKKEGTIDEKGKITYFERGVHGKLVQNEDEIKKYAKLRFEVPRAQQAAAWRFLGTQLGAKFNFKAYYYNALLPRPLKFGKRRHSEDMHRRPEEGGPRHVWFCTELLTCAMQAMNVDAFFQTPASASSPNSLWRDAVAGKLRTAAGTVERDFQLKQA